MLSTKNVLILCIINSTNCIINVICSNLLVAELTQGTVPCAIVIPSGIEKIGDRAFASCENLSNVVIPKGVKTIERFFTDCINLKRVEISEGVKGIGSVAFADCTSLAEINIPNSVISIDSSAVPI